MKKKVQKFISIIMVFTFFITAGQVDAATLDFDPNSTEVKPDSTFDVKVNVDAGTDQIAGTDIYINYDATYLELQTVTNGDYFPKVNNVPSSGRLYISGIIETQGDYKTGSGTVATVTFKALQEGSTTLTFDCDTTQTDTSKVVQNDVNATNVLECSGLQTHTVTITASADNSTDTGEELPQSGVVEDMVQYSMWGGILLTLGIGLRFILRFI